MKRLRNSTGIPDEMVKRVIAFLNEDLGLTQFDVEARNSDATLCGRAYTRGSSYHTTARPFVVLRVGTEKQKRYKRTPGSDKLTAVMRSRFPTTIAPYQYAQHKGRKVAIWNRIEALVYIAAHEMRHLWQEARRTDGRKAKADAPRFHGAKGRYSEVDTEAFALHELRKWRRQNFAL